MTTKRRFDREFKLQILQQAEHKPVAEVCREHNLHLDCTPVSSQ